MCEIERVGKDVLCPDTPGKVVAFPVRPVSRGMPFHYPVVIGDTRIVETRPRDANPGRVDTRFRATSTSNRVSNSLSVSGSESRS